MPRDVFWVAPDGRIVMQAWISFQLPDGRSEDELSREELDVHLTEAEWQRWQRENEARAREAEARQRTRLEQPRERPQAIRLRQPDLPTAPSPERFEVLRSLALYLAAAMYALLAAGMLGFVVAFALRVLVA